MTQKTYEISLEDKQWIFGQRVYKTLGECGYEDL